MTPTEVNKVSRWLQFLIIVVQALGTIIKVVPSYLARQIRSVKRR